LSAGFDIISFRTTSLGHKKEDLQKHEESIRKLSEKINTPTSTTILCFELFKFHDNWRCMEVLEDWRTRFPLPYTWRPFSDFGDQHEIINDLPAYAPPHKKACQKLIHQTHVLPSGAVTSCSQDFLGKWPVGNAIETSVIDLWNQEIPCQRRKKTQENPDDVMPICKNCKHFHYV